MMSVMSLTQERKILVLGPDQGWHADQLRSAAKRLGCRIVFAPYETLTAQVGTNLPSSVRCAAGSLDDFHAVLLRTMPMGSLEQITFRLAGLHSAVVSGSIVVNAPRALETAIDKYATLVAVRQLGYEVPPTEVVQNRSDGMAAFERLGKDCVVKPIFGGEGRGVMRVMDSQLAWYTFTTLERLGAIGYVQQFMPPGGRDTRLLVVGEQVWGVQRQSNNDWRTNVSQGGRSIPTTVSEDQREMALRIARQIGLEIGSVDVLDCDDGVPRVLEVNGVPGWKGAQTVLGIDFALESLCYLIGRVEARVGSTY